MSTAEIDFDLTAPLVRLTKDLKKASRELTRRDARWLTDQYYTIQDERIRSAAQLRHNEESAEPHALINWVFESMQRFETAIKSALGEFAATYAAGQWMQAQYGIGPVLSAAMLANFDIRKAATVGHMWRFAGLDPTSRWEKGQKRPWNAQLKAICVYRMGESFVKFQNRPACFYGKLFAEKKRTIAEANLAGEYRAVAEAEIAAKPKMTHTERWKHWHAGQIAPAHVHDRARRWTVKMFLSHLHHVMYRDYFDRDPPAPYIFEHPNGSDHRHLLLPPLWPGEYDGKPLREMKD